MVTIKINIMEGIYSETKIQQIGTMSTARKQTVVDYYRCTQLDERTMSVQIVDMDGEPLPIKEKVPLDDFLKRFTYEPDKFKVHRTPAEITADKHVAVAENHVARKEFNSAEFEFGKALKVVQDHVRASFGLGKVYLETGEMDKAANIFSKLSKQDNMFNPEHKHLLNDLGRELRGLKLYDQAIEFYEKARATVNTEDEHLLFNIARAAYEKGDHDLVIYYLDKALAINPELEPALKLKAALEGE